MSRVTIKSTEITLPYTLNMCEVEYEVPKRTLSCYKKVKGTSHLGGLQGSSQDHSFK